MLAAGAERTIAELAGAWRFERSAGGAGPPGAFGRDDDVPARNRIDADLRAQEAPRLLFRNGSRRSTGAGKTIVEAFVVPISSSV